MVGLWSTATNVAYAADTESYKGSPLLSVKTFAFRILSAGNDAGTSMLKLPPTVCQIANGGRSYGFPRLNK